MPNRSSDIKFSDAKTPSRLFRWAFQGFCLTGKELYDIVGVVILVGMLYAVLFLAIGTPFLPAGPAWAIMLMWVMSSVCGWIFERAHLPAALGMILSGMLLRNVSGGNAIRGLRSSWSKQIRAAALAVIFLRSGLEIDLQIFQKVGWSAFRLLLVPGLVEAFFDGGLAIAIFHMPPMFAFALGFILKAVGPALVIQAMFEVQQRRRGVAKMIPATVVAAASFDDAIAITGYTIFINLAVRSPGGSGWEMAHGPLSLVLGALAGLAAGVFCSFTKLWNNSFKRTSVLFVVALLMKYFFDRFGFGSGGVLGALVLGLVVKECWYRRWPRILAEDTDGRDLVRHVEKKVRFMWRVILMPILFSITGATVVFATLPSDAIGNACAIVIAGLAVRMPITFLVMMGSRFNFKEKLFIAFAWSPKATLQAALGASPMDQVMDVYNEGEPQYERYMQYAQDVLVTAVFCIIICSAFGTLLIRATAGYLLEKAQGNEDVAMIDGPHSAPVDPHPHLHPPGGGACKPPTPTALEIEMGSPGPFSALPAGASADAETASRETSTAGGSASQKLSLLAADERERELLWARHGTAALHLESIEKAVSTLARREAEGGETGAPDLGDLKKSVEQLKKKMVEDSYAAVGDDTVESAPDFLRATGAAHEPQPLRHRNTRRPSSEVSTSATSGPGPLQPPNK